jgi:hypothetical protein
LILIFSMNTNDESLAYRSFENWKFIARNIRSEVSEKLPQVRENDPTFRLKKKNKETDVLTKNRDNWLVAAKSSNRRRFLILRCRLFLSLLRRRSKVLDCSPIQRERELGLDRR